MSDLRELVERCEAVSRELNAHGDKDDAEAIDALLAVMADPSGAMIEAGFEQWASWGHAEPVESLVGRIYTAMRAAALRAREEDRG